MISANMGVKDPKPLDSFVIQDKPFKPWPNDAARTMSICLGGCSGLRKAGWLFATHLEAAYPRPLARWASCFASLVKTLQAPEPDSRLTALESLGKQSRKHPSLVPEFKFAKLMPLSEVPSEGCKVFQAPSIGGKPGELDTQGTKQQTMNPVVEVGFFHSQQELFAKALKAQHPMDKDHAQDHSPGH